MPDPIALLVAGFLLGAPDPAPARKHALADAPTRYDFEADEVVGHLQRPEGEVVRSRAGPRQPTLIEIREHFIPEILKSAEDV